MESIIIAADIDRFYLTTTNSNNEYLIQEYFFFQSQSARESSFFQSRCSKSRRDSRSTSNVTLSYHLHSTHVLGATAFHSRAENLSHGSIVQRERVGTRSLHRGYDGVQGGDKHA